MYAQRAVFGGSFNPPGEHHLIMAKMLWKHFDELIIFPCGPCRQDKQLTDNTSLMDRALMCQLTFGPYPEFELDLSDLRSGTYTPHAALADRFGPGIWYAVGSDLIVGGSKGEAAIQRWQDGERLWDEAKWAVIRRTAEVLPEDFPPFSFDLGLGPSGSSEGIRERAAAGGSLRHMVTPSVEQYIRRYGLYHLPAPVQV